MIGDVLHLPKICYIIILPNLRLKGVSVGESRLDVRREEHLCVSDQLRPRPRQQCISAAAGVGWLTMRHEAPKIFAGRLVENLDLTTPELPCGLDTRLRK